MLRGLVMVDGSKIGWPDTDLAASVNNKKHRKLVWLVCIAAIVLLTSLAVLGKSIYSTQQLKKQIPASVQTKVTFALYIAPASKLKTDKSSFNYTNDVLQFLGTIKNGDQVSISQQKKPIGTDFDLGKFLTSEGLSGGRQFSVNAGSSLIGNLRGRAICIIDTGKTIITITSTTNANTIHVEELAKLLTKL